MIHGQGRRSGGFFASRECSYTLIEVFVHYASLLGMLMCCASTALEKHSASDKKLKYSTLKQY